MTVLKVITIFSGGLFYVNNNLMYHKREKEGLEYDSILKIKRESWDE